MKKKKITIVIDTSEKGDQCVNEEDNDFKPYFDDIDNGDWLNGFCSY